MLGCMVSMRGAIGERGTLDISNERKASTIIGEHNRRFRLHGRARGSGHSPIAGKLSLYVQWLPEVNNLPAAPCFPSDRSFSFPPSQVNSRRLFYYIHILLKSQTPVYPTAKQIANSPNPKTGFIPHQTLVNVSSFTSPAVYCHHIATSSPCPRGYLVVHSCGTSNELQRGPSDCNASLFRNSLHASATL
jgi:hypothetical protein